MEEINSSFPVQYNLFTNEPEEILIDLDIIFSKPAKWRLSNSVFIVTSEDFSELIISGHNVKLSKKNERILIKDGDSPVYEIPFFKITHINIQSRGVSLSSDIIEETSKRGIFLTFSNYNGKPYAMMYSPNLDSMIQTKRKQILSYETKKAVEFSKTIVKTKLKNQSNLLKYSIKNKKENEKEEIYKSIKLIEEKINEVEKIQSEKINEVRNILLGIEGVCGKTYWNSFKKLLKDENIFNGREKRGTENPINSLLNYAYGMLYSVIWISIINAGMDPFSGFLHTDENGRPSLVLDIIENFRAPVVDRTVISFVNLGTEIQMENGLLSLTTRRNFANKIIERLETEEYYLNKKYQLKSIIQIETRKIASYFRDEIDLYQPFTFKW
jgi:CRISPR-associated protein Cas1